MNRYTDEELQKIAEDSKRLIGRLLDRLVGKYVCW